jgi:hypothetical protein
VPKCSRLGLEEHEFNHTRNSAARPRYPETLLPRPTCRVEDLLASQEQYAAEPFVRLFNPPHMPDLRGVARTISATSASPMPDQGVSPAPSITWSARRQAVQSMNLMLSCRNRGTV